MADSNLHNFDFVLAEPKFSGFADVADKAEKILDIDPAACVLNCRRAMEFAIRWMYAFDGDLDMPADDSLNAMMSTAQFRQIVDRDMRKRMDLIRKMGNAAAHEEKTVSYEEAVVCLENLHVFLDFVDYCYGDIYEGTTFHAPANGHTHINDENKDSNAELLAKLLQENASLRQELAVRRAEQQMNYHAASLNSSQPETRKVYLEALLKEEGWVFGKNLSYGVIVPGMPADSSIDYLLQKEDGTALAIVEMRYTMQDVARGRAIAEVYADCLEKLQGYRPITILTNGFDFILNDHVYPEREVATVYHPEDLKKLISQHVLLQQRPSWKALPVSGERPYQREAVQSVLDSFARKQRKTLVSMAPGTGKTRVVMGVVKTLMEAGFIRKVLYLTDKDALILQTKRLLLSLGPSVDIVADGQQEQTGADDSRKTESTMEQSKRENRYDCNKNEIVISTYDRISQKILQHTAETHSHTGVADGVKMGIGSFDLIVCDEVHQSVYRNYRDVVEYFDGLLMGLTAIPADEIDADTYGLYNLEAGNTTYTYSTEQAIQDGYLVPYQQMEVPDYGKKLWEEASIRKMLEHLMSRGIHIKNGRKLGKTIIFAINTEHCERIADVFRAHYPQYPGYCEVLEGDGAQLKRRMEDFANPKKLPQIAITAGLLETGANIPELLNLVFFKKVFGRSRFRQMLGRGNRLCPGLMDGIDKKTFAVFDYAGNFEWFATHKSTDTEHMLSLDGDIWLTGLELCYRLQSSHEQDALARREQLIAKEAETVAKLNRNHFGVRQHMPAVTYFTDKGNYAVLTEDDLQLGRKELAPLLTKERMQDDDNNRNYDKDDKNAVNSNRNDNGSAGYIDKLNANTACRAGEHNAEKLRELQILRKELREL